MRNLAFIFLLAGCAASQAHVPPIRNIDYQAFGSRYPWVLTIGDDKIVAWPFNGDEQRIWPRTQPRIEGDHRIWQSGDAIDGITIIARPGPCVVEERGRFADFVEFRTGEEGVTLEGCGGRRIRN